MARDGTQPPNASETRRESGAWKAKHARILTAALDEFIAKGFTGASMDRIAHQAKVSKVTIYNHFENKDLLYRQMIDHFLTQVHPGVPVVESERFPSLRDALMDFGCRLIEVTGQPRTLGMIRLLRADPLQFGGAAIPVGGGPQWTEAHLLPDTDKLAAVLQREAHRGKLAVDDALLAARQLSGMLLGTTVCTQLVGATSAAALTPTSKEVATTAVASCVETFMRRYAV